MTIHRLTKLKVALLRSELPQWKIAAACEIEQNDLRRYATDQKPLPRAAARRLARYFGCEPEDLDGWVEVEIEDQK